MTHTELGTTEVFAGEPGAVSDRAVHVSVRVREEPQAPHALHSDSAYSCVTHGRVLHGRVAAGAVSHKSPKQSTVGLPDAAPSLKRRHVTVRVATPPPHTDALQAPQSLSTTQRYDDVHTPVVKHGPIVASGTTTPTAAQRALLTGAPVTALTQAKVVTAVPLPHDAEHAEVDDLTASVSHTPMSQEALRAGATPQMDSSSTGAPNPFTHCTDRVRTPTPQLTLQAP